MPKGVRHLAFQLAATLRPPPGIVLGFERTTLVYPAEENGFFAYGSQRVTFPM